MELTNQELIVLSKEISLMASLDKPSEHKRSSLLNKLWKTNISSNFHDTFTQIRHLVKSEIMHRINTDKMLLI